MFFKPREQKQKTIESFSHIFQQKTRFLFLDTSKKKDSKKKKQSSKYEAKETRVFQNEKSLFKTEKKDQTWKNNIIFEKAQQKRKQRKRIFFDGKEKTEKEIWAEA